MLKSNFRHIYPARFIKAVWPGLILIFMLALAACGDQSTPLASPKAAAVGGPASSPSTAANQGQSQSPAVAGSTATTHICTLLTKDDVAASIGTVVDTQASADELGEFGGANCNYVSNSGGLTVQVSITGESQADFEKNTKSDISVAVPDLGNAAFFQGGQLSTFKGKIVLVLLLVNPAKGSETLNNATVLSRKILASMENTSLASDLLG